MITIGSIQIFSPKGEGSFENYRVTKPHEVSSLDHPHCKAEVKAVGDPYTKRVVREFDDNPWLRLGAHKTQSNYTLGIVKKR